MCSNDRDGNDGDGGDGDNGVDGGGNETKSTGLATVWRPKTRSQSVSGS